MSVNPIEPRLYEYSLVSLDDLREIMKLDENHWERQMWELLKMSNESLRNSQIRLVKRQTGEKIELEANNPINASALLSVNTPHEFLIHKDLGELICRAWRSHVISFKFKVTKNTIPRAAWHAIVVQQTDDTTIYKNAIGIDNDGKEVENPTGIRREFHF